MLAGPLGTVGAGGSRWAQAVCACFSVLLTVMGAGEEATAEWGRGMAWSPAGQLAFFFFLACSSLGIEHGSGASLATPPALTYLTQTGLGLLCGGSACLALKVPPASLSGPRRV